MRLVIDHVSKRYGDRAGKATMALQNITLTVDHEEFVAIVGPSGSGKSTLLAMVAGLTDITSGEIYFSGLENGVDPRIGVVFQEHALFPWRTVIHNIEFGLEQRGIGKKERREKAFFYVEMMGLTGFEHKFPHQLSGGMRQRVGIARALAIQPDLLLMDEPLSALDAQTRLILQEELLRIWNHERHNTLYVTHNIQEAVALADRVVVLTSRPGQIAEVVNIAISKNDRDQPEMQRAMAEYSQQIWHLIRNDAERALKENASG